MYNRRLVMTHEGNIQLLAIFRTGANNTCPVQERTKNFKVNIARAYYVL